MPNIVIHNIEIERKPFVKFLGITIDDSLKWDKHISNITNKLTSSLYALRCSKNYLTEKAKKTLYHALFQSHINYGLLLWGSSAKTHTNRIWKLQKKAVRIIASATYNAHTNPLFF